MNRISTFVSTAVLAATVAAGASAAPFGVGLGIQFNNQQFQNQNLGIQLQTPRIRDALRTTCVDLSVQTSQHTNPDGSIRVEIRVANNSGVDYTSELGQQMLVVNGSNGGASTVENFWLIRTGESILWTDTFHPFEFPATYQAHIAFDPDIRLDGNPNNDDCRASNNQGTLTTVR